MLRCVPVSREPTSREGQLWRLCTLCLMLLSSCAAPPLQQSSPKELAEHLCKLGPSVERTEASIAAETAYSYSLQLAKEYRVVPPALLHNMLVNMGIRQRGLCFQWADDLSDRLESLHLHSLVLHRGVAMLETRHEHSSVVLTSQGQPFDQGIVLDAWRNSGHLFWSEMKRDTKYVWIEVEVLPDDQAQNPAN